MTLTETVSSPPQPEPSDVLTERRPDARPADASPAGEELVEDELLVEEISIDGMCGVY
ncbi:MAG: mycofactocin precursor MftA [Acidimicrobiales bacterium]|jgi:mycofactocin precursor